MSKHFTRAQVGQALECAYIQPSELEEVIDNVLAMLREAWEEGLQEGLQGGWEDNPYKESE